MSAGLRYILTFASAAVYFFVWFKLGARKNMPRADGTAWASFRSWWLLLAIFTVEPPFAELLASAGVTLLSVQVGLFLFANLILSAALWGLLYYLLYIYTGREDLRWWLAALYGVFYLGVIYYTIQRRPLSVEFGGGSVTIVYQDQASILFSLALIILLILPTIIASLALLSLYFKVRERSQRYRLIVVSVSLLFWFGGALLSVLTTLGDQPWWQVTSRITGLVVALSIFWAYFPPGFIQARFNVSGLD